MKRNVGKPIVPASMYILLLTLVRHMKQTNQLSQVALPTSLFQTQYQQEVFERFRLVISSFEQHSFQVRLF